MDIDKYFPYEKVRESQRISLLEIIKSYENGDSHFILEAPTGVGKSGIAIAFSKYLSEKGKRTTIITKTKALQNQYLNEFKELVDLKGKTNYSCPFKEEVIYKDELCSIFRTSGRCSPKRDCPYIKKREVWMKSSKIRMTNFAFMTECCSLVCVTRGLNRSDVTIIDECHNIPEEISSRSSIEFSLELLKENIISPYKTFSSEIDININIKELVNKYINLKDLIFSGTEDSIFSVSDGFLENIKEFHRKLEFTIDSMETYKDELSKKQVSILKEFGIEKALKDHKMPKGFNKLFRYLKDMNNNIKNVSSSEIGDIFVSDISNKVKITPMFAANTSEYVLFRKGDFHLHMSATIGNFEVYKKELGISNEKIGELRLPGEFKKENRPIYFIPIVYFSNRNKDESLNKISEFINSLIDSEEYKDKKGIIHTTSFEHSEVIFSKLKNKKRLIISRGFEDFMRFKNSKEPKILIGPSIFEGYDFKDELARFQILTKIQYGFLGDLYIKKKASKYPAWYSKEASTKLTQAYGRGVRHHSDYCDFFILDGNFSRLFREKNFPYWVEEAIQTTNMS